MEGQMPVLWLCGPAGVGKSTVAWQLYKELSQAGVHVAFADADQLCMCYPPQAGDPDRERLKATNLAAMIPHYQAAGARCVVLAGVLDPVLGLRRELLPDADVTVVRLRADREELVRRFAERAEKRADLDQLLRDVRDQADRMDVSDFADLCVETTGVPASGVAGLVRNSCPGWPGFGETISEQAASPREIAHPEASRADGRVLLICGPTGVGKSTIAFRVYMQSLNAGFTAGYVDLDQIGFVSPPRQEDPGIHRLKARNLAAMCENYRAAGATHLIACGPIENNEALRTYIDALPAASITLCRLHAGPEELTRRVISRGSGGSWPQPGDPLLRQSAEYLRAVARQAISADATFEREHLGTVRIDTNGHTPDESASLIAAATGWPNSSDF